ncbi:MAG: Rrf2 family transcriptional regulator [Planctomycetes bacterium]|nr:Rrf2 family transcriptional regulator [Planctomycetota bacterium]
MRFLQTTEHAIDSLVYMAVHQDREPILVSEIAKAQHLSAPYLSKVFQRLAHEGVLRSYRGAKGGYALARDPSAISLQDIVRVTEGESPMYQCMAIVRRCELGSGCRIIRTFQEAEDAFLGVLAKVSLADVVADLRGQRQGVPWIRDEARSGVRAGAPEGE